MTRFDHSRLLPVGFFVVTGLYEQATGLDGSKREHPTGSEEFIARSFEKSLEAAT